MSQTERDDILRSMLRTIAALNASVPTDREPVEAGGQPIELSDLEKHVLLVLQRLVAERRESPLPGGKGEDQRRHCLHDHLESICVQWWAPSAAATFRISKQLASLKRLGLIRQITVQADARQRAWGLTGTGEEYLTRLTSRQTSTLSRSLEAVSENEIQACESALSALAEAAWERLKKDAGLVKRSASARS